jgi:ABC-type nitrate/sulfonate/bicarbonate transport system permease component
VSARLSEGGIARSAQLTFVVLVALVWFALARSGSVSPLFLPPIGRVFGALAELVRTNVFWAAVGTTMTTLLRAYVIALVCGIGVAYAVTRSRFFTDLLEPVIAGFFTVPITLFFPIFVLFFGIGAQSKVAYAAVYAFFPIAITSIAGFSAVEGHYVRSARCMGASAYGVFRRILLPGAMPVIFAGLRVGFFICFASVLGGETLASVNGIGRQIAQNAELMESATMFAWIMVVIGLTTAANLLMSGIERHVIRH